MKRVRSFTQIQINRSMKNFQLIVLLLLCVYGTLEQEILSISSFESCFTVSVGGVQLSCSETDEIATIMDLRVTPSSSEEGEQKFLVNLSTLPPNSMSTQVRSSNSCQIVDQNNKCQTTPNTLITVTASKPSLRYRLTPSRGSKKNPFTVPMTYVFVRGDMYVNDYTGCYLLDTRNGETKNIPLTNEEIEGIINGTFNSYHGTDYHYKLQSSCEYLTNKLKLTSGVKNNYAYYLSNTLDCGSNQETLTNKLYSYFFFLETNPQCVVYEIENPAQVVSQVTIEIENELGKQTIELETVQGTAKTSSDGRVVARIEDVQTPTGNIGIDIPGIIVVCYEDNVSPESAVLNMAPPNQPIGTNPFKIYEQNNPGDLPNAVYPTPETIGKILNKELAYTSWMYFNRTQTPAFGEQFGQMGVASDLYATVPNEYMFSSYLDQLRAQSNSESQAFFFTTFFLLNTEIATGVPGFGFPFQGIEVPDMCTVLQRFYRAETSTSSDPPREENVPFPYDPKKPNMWLDNNYLYHEPAPQDIAFEVVINFAGSFVTVGAVVPSASINLAASACSVTDDPSGCGTITNSNGTRCAIHVQLCNPTTNGEDGDYLLSTTCRDDSNLLPLGFAGELPVFGVPSGKCVNVEVPLTVTSLPLPQNPGPTCDVTVFSADGDIDPNSVILDQQTFVCSVDDEFVPPPTFASPNAPLSPGTFTGPQSPPDDNSTLIAWIVFGIIALLILSLLIMLLVFCILKCKTKNLA